jgi:hypothetical protein
MNRAIRITRRVAIVAAVLAFIEHWFYVPRPRELRDDWHTLSAALDEYRETHA